MTLKEKLIQNYTEDQLAEMIDEQMTDYVDQDQCDEEFDGDTYECYIETGNNAAESDIFNQIVGDRSLYTEQEIEDAQDWFTDDMGFSL